MSAKRNPIEYKDASPEVRAVYDDIMATRKTDWVNNFWKVLAHDPASLRRIWANIKELTSSRLKARDSYSARKAALNHLSSRFDGFLLLAISSIAHFTGATGVSRPENVDRADPVGVFLETTRDAGEAFLCLPVLCRNRVAPRTTSAGVLRRYEDQFTAAPPQLVSQLPAELEPALIEDGFVQAGLGSNLLARSFPGTGRRLGHVAHL
jgi:hypothetical protein